MASSSAHAAFNREGRTARKKQQHSRPPPLPKLDELVMEEVELAFSLYRDDDDRGREGTEPSSVHRSDLEGLFRSLGLKATEEEIRRMIRDVDESRRTEEEDDPTGERPHDDERRRQRRDGTTTMSGGDGESERRVTFEEFLEMAAPLLLKRDPDEETARAFELFAEPSGGGSASGRASDDVGGGGRGHQVEGVITVDSLRRAARELGETLSELELAGMIGEADGNGDGVVDLDEYAGFMRRRSGDLLDELTSDEESV